MDKVAYWTKGQAWENFGDALTRLLLKLGCKAEFVPAARYHLIGSVIDDNNIREDIAQIEPNEKVALWGCGARGYQGLSEEIRKRALILGVRGPLSRRALDLPADTPIGDPALLLPYIYEPKPSDIGHVNLCVTHALHDCSSDDIKKMSGADVVLSARITPGQSEVELMIDRIAGAKFVLAGALHAAIIACAYGKPFAFFDGGYIDVPFKWDDFAQSVEIPSYFVQNQSEAYHLAEVRPIRPRIPSLAPLLSAFPFHLDPSIVARVAARNLSVPNRPESFDVGASSDRALQIEVERQRLQTEQYEARISTLRQRSQKIESSLSEAIVATVGLQQRVIDLQAELVGSQKRVVELQTDIQAANADKKLINHHLKVAHVKIEQVNNSNTALSEQLVNVQEKLQIETDEQFRLRAHVSGLSQQLDSLTKYLEDIKRSTSWRITRPVRMAGGGVRKVLQGGSAWLLFKPGSRPRRVARRLVNRIRDTKAGRELYVSKQSEISRARFQVGTYADKSVAVLVPSSAAGVEGGAERFYLGLLNALKAYGCKVELVSAPVDESSFSGIQAGYSYFSSIDLAHFDLVISTKAPTYVVNHRNHVVYLVHTMRVFYDMFDVVFPNATSTVEAQRSWIVDRDSAAMSRLGSRFSIGSEVSRRLLKWNNVESQVLHPPLDIDGFHNMAPGDYFFMPGRLHAWKRVDLAIRAILLSSLPMKLLVAGTGEAEEYLRTLASGDPRIEFLGRVDDGKLKDLYAAALAVPFLPVREDYGYVTLEAFASGKPVITCSDSGEPTVFVQHEQTGLICAPDVKEISEAFERLWTDRDFTRRLGQTGRKRVSGMNWEFVAGRLLHAGFPNQLVEPLKVAILDMQPISPAVGGGRLRLLGLYHALGVNIQGRYVGTYDWPGESYRRHHVSDALEEITVPLSEAHHKLAAEAAERAGGKTVIDLLFSRHAHLSPEYLKATMDAVIWADVVVFSHPWIAPLVSDELLFGKTVVYDAHNVESDLREQLLDLVNPFERDILDHVIETERLAGDRADLILACSDADKYAFSKLYGWKSGKVRVVPNGVFSEIVRPPSGDQKIQARESLALPHDVKVGFFIGSDYAPNVEAGRFIIEQIAPQLEEAIFVIAGGVCSRLPSELPSNVRCVGFVDDVAKINWLHASDFAVNPMFSGSGTNVKMFDFMSAGLPVVSTFAGARGIATTSTDGLSIVSRQEFVAATNDLILALDRMRQGGLSNRETVKAQYAWENLSPDVGSIIRSVHLKKLGNALLYSNDGRRFRVSQLATTGLKCGIGEYSRKVMQAYERHGIPNYLLACLAANEEPKLTGLPWPAKISWFQDNVEWRSSRIESWALNDVLDFESTHLIVQFHPSFLPADELKAFLFQAAARGVKPVIVVHNFVADCAALMRDFNGLGFPLFSHRLTEVNQARQLGVEMILIPMGIDASAYITRRNITQRDLTLNPPVLITTGFLRAHKGVLTLIKAMPAILRRFPGTTLMIQCSIYSSDDSERTLLACQNEIKALGLSQQVILDTGFHDRDTIEAQLSKADLAVLPYDHSNEGGSATAADCIAVGLPLIVSEAEIFDEIREKVLTTRADAQSVAEAVIEVLSQPQLYSSLADRSYDHAKEHSWGSVAGMLIASDSTRRG